MQKYKIMMFTMHHDKEKKVLIKQYVKVIGKLSWSEAKEYRAKSPREFLIVRDNAAA